MWKGDMMGISIQLNLKMYIYKISFLPHLHCFQENMFFW